MSITRRAAVLQLALAGWIQSALVRHAHAQTYTYDERGRVIGVEQNGQVITYEYDDAGNRTEVVRASSPPSPPPPLPPPPPTPPSTFTDTIQITGTSPVNLRTLANAAGFNGEQNANITFEVGNGVTITGAAGGGIAIDTGLWPTGSQTVTLALTVKNGGKVRGGGGSGGRGGDAYANGEPGTAGGDAIHCRAPITITFQSGSEARGGGGGGGGGAGAEDGWPEPQQYGGGGGGGGAPNGTGGAGGLALNNGGAGSNGTTSSGGAGGASPTTPGGAGGGYGAAGGNGSSWLTPPASGGVAGVAGYCVRKNGFTVPVTNNGTTSGTIG